MQKAHVNQNWQNKPSINTPINETNLNKLDRSVDTIDDRVISLDTTKANLTDMLIALKNITFDRATGVFTITKFNNTSFTIDTDLEKIAVNFDYDDDPTSPHYQNLILTLIDGTVKYIDLSALITQFEFVDTSTIHFSVGADGKIYASIINGSITENMLQPNFLAECRTEVSKATQQADLSNSYRRRSEAYAVGTIDGIAVSDTDEAYNNNSKHYSEIAGTYASNAAGSASSASVSETNASTSELNAATSAANASTSELNAATSAANASTSETNAETSASNAANSETNAAESETNAASSALAALESETNAANSATYAEAAEEAIEEIISGIRPMPRGIWNEDTTYYMLDLVYYNYNNWMAKRENINIPPEEGDDWQLFVASPDNIVLTQVLEAGETELTFTDIHITNTAMVEIFTDISGVIARNIVQNNTSITITFRPMNVDVNVKITIKEG